MSPSSFTPAFRPLQRLGLGGDDLHGVLALLPVLAVRCMADGPVLAWQRLGLLALAVAAAYVWSAVVTRRLRPAELGAQLRFGLLFVVLMYEPIGWGGALFAASFGWLFVHAMFGGRPVLSPAIAALAFALFAAPDGGVEEMWISNTAPVMETLIACAVGAAWLLWRRSLAWMVPLGVAAGLAAAITAFPDAAPWWHHLSIGTLPAAVLFVGADRRFTPDGFGGQALHGVLIGALIVCMRLANPDQPDGVVFAVLLGSLFAPLMGRLFPRRAADG